MFNWSWIELHAYERCMNQVCSTSCEVQSRVLLFGFIHGKQQLWGRCKTVPLHKALQCTILSRNLRQLRKITMLNTQRLLYWKKTIDRLIFEQIQSSIENSFFSIECAFFKRIAIEFSIDFWKVLFLQKQPTFYWSLDWSLYWFLDWILDWISNTYIWWLDSHMLGLTLWLRLAVEVAG